MPEISILLVEDETITLEYLYSTLTIKYSGMTIHRAYDGEEGLELFEAHSPQIVITDLNMPGMDGKQMASRIRSIKPDSKFIALTGFMDETASAESAENSFQFDYYIVKPIMLQELFYAVEQCVNDIEHHDT